MSARPGVVIAGCVTTATILLHLYFQPETVAIPVVSLPKVSLEHNTLPPEEDAWHSEGIVVQYGRLKREMGPAVQKNRSYPIGSTYGRIPRCRWDGYPRALNPETNTNASREVLVFMSFLDEVVYQRLGYTYSLRDGSLLGAVRQGGMIPGDADLDAVLLLPLNETLDDVYRVRLAAVLRFYAPCTVSQLNARHLVSPSFLPYRQEVDRKLGRRARPFRLIINNDGKSRWLVFLR